MEEVATLSTTCLLVLMSDSWSKPVRQFLFCCFSKPLLVFYLLERSLETNSLCTLSSQAENKMNEKIA